MASHVSPDPFSDWLLSLLPMPLIALLFSLHRFRSLTKQFFRKADGVIVMYDITSSNSFTEVRYWLASVKETVDDNVAVLLLGNKIDDVAHRQVPTPEGQRLAQ
ncbi:EF-hand calcium-binding domain-containing protein 4B-like, partial [Chiloscyllium plagiosum]|uniref:EF-hand calcium-binding domain-containing protein 4B-like n=1 Tax=Chiloscyllium plagiosum TaxID=36176 RepID=UPI001CB87B7C